MLGRDLDVTKLVSVHFLSKLHIWMKSAFKFTKHINLLHPISLRIIRRDVEIENYKKSQLISVHRQISYFNEFTSVQKPHFRLVLVRKYYIICLKTKTPEKYDTTF
jgi:hypothetical protein